MPFVIAHRGASGYRPEHTLEAYALGARLGAEYIEPDLVATLDGELVARHENEISTTTDVAARPEFAGRRRTVEIDGIARTGWFTEDFTLAELKTLRARERIPGVRPANAAYDGRFQIPTFQEIIDLARVLSDELGRPIGIYPETKHPTYFRSIGRPLEPPLIRALRDNGLDEPDARVFVQSFETANLRALAGELRVPLIQLIGARARPYDFVASGDERSFADLAAPKGLAWVASYADGVGPAKSRIVPRDADQRSRPPTTLVADAHAAGLQVHAYTFRSENAFLPLELRSAGASEAYGRHAGEYARFYALGVDAVFADQPDHAVAARASLRP